MKANSNKNKGIMMKKNKLILILFILLFLPQLTEAISIGISPGRVTFDNMLKGGYAEKTVRISTNSDKDIIARLEVKGEIKEWLRLEPDNKTFTLSSTKPYELKLILQPPNDTRSDSYSGSISFITERFGEIKGRAGGFVKAGVILMIDVIVSDEEIILCKSGAFNFEDIEIGFPLKLKKR